VKGCHRDRVSKGFYPLTSAARGERKGGRVGTLEACGVGVLVKTGSFFASPNMIKKQAGAEKQENSQKRNCNKGGGKRSKRSRRGLHWVDSGLTQSGKKTFPAKAAKEGHGRIPGRGGGQEDNGSFPDTLS